MIGQRLLHYEIVEKLGEGGSRRRQAGNQTRSLENRSGESVPAIRSRAGCVFSITELSPFESRLGSSHNCNNGKGHSTGSPPWTALEPSGSFVYNRVRRSRPCSRPSRITLRATSPECAYPRVAAYDPAASCFRVSSANSHALAILQSRFTVSTETSRTSAVSSMLKPPK